MEGERELRGGDVRLGHAMELILAIALAIALVRGQAQEPIMRAWMRGGPTSLWIRVGGGNALTAFALVGAACLAWESARRRGPARWGPGRLIWSATGIYAAINVAAVVISLLATEFRRRGTCPTVMILTRVVRSTCTDQFLHEFPWALLAVGLTTRLSGWPAVEGSDPREFAGRQFAGLILAVSVTYRLAEVFGV